MIRVIEQRLMKASFDIVRPYSQTSRGMALHSNYAPKITPDLDADTEYAIDLRCEARITIANETVCVMMAEHHARIQLSRDLVENADVLDKILLVTLPDMLANDARVTISRLSIMAGYPQAVLPMQNFGGLFAKMMADRPAVPAPLENVGVAHVH